MGLANDPERPINIYGAENLLELSEIPSLTKFIGKTLSGIQVTDDGTAMFFVFEGGASVGLYDLGKESVHLGIGHTIARDVGSN